MASIKGSSTNYLEVEPNLNAARVVTYPPNTGAAGVGGAFQAIAVSGVLVAITGFPGTNNGQLVSLQNLTTGIVCVIERIKLAFQITVLPSTAQEYGFGLVRTTAGTVQAAAGGAAITKTTPNTKKRGGTALYAAPALNIYAANSTTEITTGTYTPDTTLFADERDFALVAGAAVPKNKTVLELDYRFGRPIVLAAGEGLLGVATVTMANALAGRLVTTVEWAEMAAYPQ